MTGLVGLSDAIVIGSAGLAILFLYVDWGRTTLQLYLMTIAVQIALSITAFKIRGLYEFNTIVEWPSKMRDMLLLLTLVVLIMVATAFAFQISVKFSRFWFFSSVIVSAGMLGVSRGIAKSLIERMARAGVLVRNVAIIGVSDQAQHLIAELKLTNTPWKQVIGIFDERKTRVAQEVEGLPVVGDLDELIRQVRLGVVHDVVITLPWSADQRLVSIVHKLRSLPVHIYLGADMIGYRFPRHRQEAFEGVPVMHISSAPLTGWSGLVKLIEDKVLASAILVLFAPIMLLIAIAIKIDSRGPVFFRQKRYGFNNQLIEVWKFRSMFHEAQDATAERLTSRNDPRVTTVGGFIRRTSLDELPQLLNVLRGEMSIVGPRPHAVKAKAGGRLYEEVVAEYAVRHKVKPGLTGWAQVNGWRGETEREEEIIKRVEHDLYYIENWSLFFDLKILLMTALYGWSGKKAY